MREEQKRALFLIGDCVELYPPESAAGPDVELRGIKTKIKAVQFGADPEAQIRRPASLGPQVAFLPQDLWRYKLHLEGTLGKRQFREDWIRPGQSTSALDPQPQERA